MCILSMQSQTDEQTTHRADILLLGSKRSGKTAYVSALISRSPCKLRYQPTRKEVLYFSKLPNRNFGYTVLDTPGYVTRFLSEEELTKMQENLQNYIQNKPRGVLIFFDMWDLESKATAIKIHEEIREYEVKKATYLRSKRPNFLPVFIIGTRYDLIGTVAWATVNNLRNLRVDQDITNLKRHRIDRTWFFYGALSLNQFYFLGGLGRLEFKHYQTLNSHYQEESRLNSSDLMIAIDDVSEAVSRFAEFDKPSPKETDGLISANNTYEQNCFQKFLSCWTRTGK